MLVLDLAARISTFSALMSRILPTFVVMLLLSYLIIHNMRKLTRQAGEALLCLLSPQAGLRRTLQAHP